MATRPRQYGTQSDDEPRTLGVRPPTLQDIAANRGKVTFARGGTPVVGTPKPTILDIRAQKGLPPTTSPKKPSRSETATTSNGRSPFLQRLEDWMRRTTSGVWPPRNVQSSPVVDNTQYNKSLEDFIAAARALISENYSSELGALSNQEAALRRNAADIQSQLRGGYSGLSSFIDGQAPKIQEAYQTGIQGIADTEQQTQASISEASAAAQAQQQAILDRLGIADANIVLANKGNTLEEDTARAQTDSAQRSQNVQNQLNSNMSTALEFNTSAGTAAGLEGQGEQNRINRELFARLAELADQRRSIQSASQADIPSLAMGLMDNDYRLWSDNYDRRFNADNVAYDRAQQLASAQGTTPELTSTRWASLGPFGQAQYALQESGVDAQTSQAIMQAIYDEYTSNNRMPSASEFIRMIQERLRETGANPVTTANAAQIYYSSLAD